MPSIIGKIRTVPAPAHCGSTKTRVNAGDLARPGHIIGRAAALGRIALLEENSIAIGAGRRIELGAILLHVGAAGQAARPDLRRGVGIAVDVGPARQDRKRGAGDGVGGRARRRRLDRHLDRAGDQRRDLRRRRKLHAVAALEDSADRDLIGVRGGNGNDARGALRRAARSPISAPCRSRSGPSAVEANFAC